MIQNKISNFTFEEIKNELGGSFSMPVDATDSVRSCPNEYQFNQARKELMEKFGDVEVRVDINQAWWDKVTILDEKFNEALERFYKAKSEWCSKYGCN